MDMQSVLEKLNCTQVSPLTKGWSRDKKFLIRTVSGKRYLLRISDAALYEKKKEQFALLKKLESLGISCSLPVDFGVFGDGSVYMILTYLEGNDGKEALSGANDATAYRLGTEAGKVLKQLHGVPIPKQEKSWWERYKEKMPRKIDALINCAYTLPKQALILEYYRDNCCLMENRPLTFTHGDYHLGNMIAYGGKISIIDFDKAGAADPYDDFKPFCWNVMESEYFETGLINGYFDDHVPEDFFTILKFYTAESLVSHLPWSMGFGQKEIETALTVADHQMRWYGGFFLDVPTWYKGIIPQKTASSSDI